MPFAVLFRCRPIIFACCENHEGYISIVSGHSAEFLVLKPGEANTNKKDLKFQGFFYGHMPQASYRNLF